MKSIFKATWRGSQETLQGTFLTANSNGIWTKKLGRFVEMETYFHIIKSCSLISYSVVDNGDSTFSFSPFYELLSHFLVFTSFSISPDPLIKRLLCRNQYYKGSFVFIKKYFLLFLSFVKPQLKKQYPNLT